MKKLLVLIFLLPLAACTRVPFSIDALPAGIAHTEGASIGYRVTGHGPPLLFLMGYGGTMQAWSPELVQELASSHTVILADHRGMGCSTTDHTSLTIERMAEDASGLLQTLHIEKADIIGWSMGAVIAQELAFNHPKQVDHLILYGPSCTQAVGKKALEILGDFSTIQQLLFPAAWLEEHPNVWETLPQTPPPNPDMMAQQKKALLQWRGSAARLPELRSPTLLIVGTEDILTPPSEAIRMAQLIPGAWLVQFKEGGHWLMYQAPHEMARIINAFCAADASSIR